MKDGGIHAPWVKEKIRISMIRYRRKLFLQSLGIKA
jgi:hypothetical protein